MKDVLLALVGGAIGGAAFALVWSFGVLAWRVIARWFRRRRERDFLEGAADLYGLRPGATREEINEAIIGRKEP